jgi:hypothetical protein
VFPDQDSWLMDYFRKAGSILVQTSKDGCIISKILHMGKWHFIKFAPAGKCSGPSDSLYGEAKAYHGLPPGVRAHFVEVVGYFPGYSEGDYLVTVAPAGEGKCYSPGDYLDAHPDVTLERVLDAIHRTLALLFANRVTHQDLHCGNLLLVGPPGDIRVVLMDPGCWEARGAENPYLTQCDAFLTLTWGIDLANHDEYARSVLLNMLDAVSAITDSAYDVWQTADKDRRAALEDLVPRFIRSRFGWNVRPSLRRWNDAWSRELARCVSEGFVDHFGARNPPS